jgi:PAP2 superfamily
MRRDWLFGEIVRPDRDTPRRVVDPQVEAPTPLSRRQFLGRVGTVALGAASMGLAGRYPVAMAAAPGAPGASEFSVEVPTAWFDLSLTLVKETAGFSPPVASRALGLAGIALYEAVVPGMPDHRSLSGQLNALRSVPNAGRGGYHWPAVANSALASMLRRLYPTASASNLARIDGLETGFASRFSSTLPGGVFQRSVDRGTDVATTIFDWSRGDGGHEGYLRNFPPDYIPPVGPGLWVPTPPGFQRALQPLWGSNRPCVLSSGAACPPPPPTAYSEDPSSRFYREAAEVFDTVNGLTTEQRTIALYWSDDPGATSTPPGHSVSMTTQVLRQLGASLDVAAEAYVRTGLAVSDAFIACWNAKYQYNLLRPITYIQNLIDPAWSSLLVTPPFPEYTSGHSVQSGAWAQVMTDMLGPMAFTDRTHEDRGFSARSFGSFFEAANEAAISRLYGGIHYRPAIEDGIDQGRCVGRAVGSLRFHD